MITLCDYCQKTSDWLDDSLVNFSNTTEGNGLLRSLKPFKEIDTVDSCHLCQDILKLRQKMSKVFPGEPFLVIRIEKLPPGERTQIYISPLQVVKGKMQVILAEEYPEAEHTDSLLYEASNYDQRFIDLARARDWLRRCDNEHNACIQRQRQKPNLSLLLVDVQEECVTLKNCSDVQYSALSYVWGNAEVTKATSENIQDLQTPGSLSPQSQVAVIPRTVRDAMNITAGLGLRYLWVDCLCIIQDDPEILSYLGAMSAIYSSAYITLIAADGKDANYGITGTKRALAPNCSPCFILRFANYRMRVVDTVDRSGIDQMLFKSWAHRGWTFQEGFFASRALVFSGFMTWICGTSLQEQRGITQLRYGLENETSWFLSIAMRYLCQASHAQSSNWQTYCSLVRIFNTRTLAYEQDVMRAFAGVISFFGEIQGDIFYGHPAEFFELSLLWNPDSNVPNKRRSLPVRKDGTPMVPSWSWYAWHGSLGLDIWTSYKEPHHPIPLIAAHKLCLLCEKRTPLQSTCCIADRIMDATPQNSSEKFSPFLFFKTQRTRLRIKYDQNSCSAEIVDFPRASSEEFAVIGEVRFNDLSYVELDRGYQGATSTSGTHQLSAHEYEFISIAVKRKRTSPKGPSSRHSYPRKTHALCVTWNRGWAERIGIAIIMEKGWNRAVKEEIDVVLG